MAKLSSPFFSFSARGRLGKLLSLRGRGASTIAEKKPEVPNQKTPAQLNQRLMWQQCTAFWNLLSDLEKKQWDSLARPQHMPGYALWMSSCLKPNPGIYLPLAGGQMTGDITMAGAQTVDGVDISAHPPASTGVHNVGARFIAQSTIDALDLASHKTRHQNGGDDEISVAALDGEPSTLTTHKGLDTGVHGVGANFIPLAPAASHLVRTFTKGWTANKMLLGAGVNANPTEIARPTMAASAYQGTGVANRAVAHGLGLIPKFVHIISASTPMWYTQHYFEGWIYYLSAAANGRLAVTVMDATNFYVGNATSYQNSANVNNDWYVWFAIG